MSETVKSQTSPTLADLFGAALRSVAAQREEINALDGFNGNHGDNMVQNLQIITGRCPRRETNRLLRRCSAPLRRCRCRGEVEPALITARV